MKTAAILIMLLIIVFSPFVTLWALNTLFPVLSIPYTFETWLATMIVSAFLKANVTISR